MIGDVGRWVTNSTMSISRKTKRRVSGHLMVICRVNRQLTLFATSHVIA